MQCKDIKSFKYGEIIASQPVVSKLKVFSLHLDEVFGSL